VPISEKDRLAAEVEDRWVDFQDGFSNKRRYPVEQFRAFWEAGKRYAELTKNDPLIHREVVAAINGLREFLEVERKRIPGTIIADLTAWSPCSSADTIPISRGMNPQGCESGEAGCARMVILSPNATLRPLTQTS
jgi:hypothetical protein